MKLSVQEKKQREVERWEREKARPKQPGYLIYFILIIAVVYVAEELFGIRTLAVDARRAGGGIYRFLPRSKVDP